MDGVFYVFMISKLYYSDYVGKHCVTENNLKKCNRLYFDERNVTKLKEYVYTSVFSGWNKVCVCMYVFIYFIFLFIYGLLLAPLLYSSSTNSLFLSKYSYYTYCCN